MILLQQLLSHFLHIRSCQVVHHLAVILVEVGIVVELVPDDVAPVVVGDCHLSVLLLQILLHLIHTACHRTMVGDVQELLVDDRIQFLVTLGVALVGNAKQGIRIVLFLEVEAYATPYVPPFSSRTESV